MSKTIQSPSKRWPGSVTIADPLTLPHAEAIEQVLGGPQQKGRIFYTVLDKPCLPAIIACVEKWNIGDFPETGVTVGTFPMSPRNASHELIEWLFSEILKVYSGELDIPNE